MHPDEVANRRIEQLRVLRDEDEIDTVVPMNLQQRDERRWLLAESPTRHDELRLIDHDQVPMPTPEPPVEQRRTSVQLAAVDLDGSRQLNGRITAQTLVHV